MPTVVLIGVAGSLGALSRYWVEGIVSRRFPGVFPLGTFVVNVSGAFALGLLFTLMTERFMISPQLRTATTIGFLGAYTTFSTLSFETLRLIQDGAYLAAVANGLGTMVIGLGAVYLGIVLGRAI